MTNFDTVREALAAIADTHVHTYKQALAALSELERLAGEPVYWQWRRKGHEWTLEYTFANEVQVTTKDSERRALFAAPVAQQPQARPDFTDEWTGYLKDGETPFERFLRERKDLSALTKLYQRALEENERLKAQPHVPEANCGNITPAELAKRIERGEKWEVAQQPQEPDWKHPKIQALIGADARNRIVIDLIWRILKEPEGGWSLNDSGLKDLKSHLNKYGLSAVLAGIDKASESYIKTDEETGNATAESVNLAWSKLGGILAMANLPDEERGLHYVKGILRNRLNYVPYTVVRDLKHALMCGVSVEDMKLEAKHTRSWTAFSQWLDSAIEDANGQG